MILNFISKQNNPSIIVLNLLLDNYDIKIKNSTTSYPVDGDTPIIDYVTRENTEYSFNCYISLIDAYMKSNFRFPNDNINITLPEYYEFLYDFFLKPDVYDIYDSEGAFYHKNVTLLSPTLKLLNISNNIEINFTMIERREFNNELTGEPYNSPLVSLPVQPKKIGFCDECLKDNKETNNYKSLTNLDCSGCYE